MLTDGKSFPKGGRVLVIVPTTSLVEQMHSDFINYGMPEGECIRSTLRTKQ